MRSRVLISVLLAVLIIITPSCGAIGESGSGDNQDTDVIIEDIMSDYDFSEWNEATGSEISAEELIYDTLNGENADIEVGSIFNSVIEHIKGFITENRTIFIVTAMSALITALLNALIPGDNKDIRRLIGYAVGMLCISIVATAFTKTVELAVNAADSMAGFCEASAPIIGVMLTASGRVASGGVYSPLSAALAVGCSVIIKGMIVPIACFGAVAVISASLTGREQLKGMSSLAKSAVKWIIGISTTVFLGIMTIKGLSAGAHDGVAYKTAKYIADKSIPFAGGMMAGTVDTVSECMRSVRIASGMAGVVGVITMLAEPVLHMIGFSVCFRLASVFCSVSGNGDLNGMLSGLSDIISYFVAAVCICGVMVIILIGIFASMGG